MSKTSIENRPLARSQPARAQQIDQDAERRRMLAEIYELLVSLADEADEDLPYPDSIDEVEKTGEPATQHIGQKSDETSDCPEPEVLKPIVGQ